MCPKSSLSITNSVISATSSAIWAYCDGPGIAINSIQIKSCKLFSYQRSMVIMYEPYKPPPRKGRRNKNSSNDISMRPGPPVIHVEDCDIFVNFEALREHVPEHFYEEHINDLRFGDLEGHSAPLTTFEGVHIHIDEKSCNLYGRHVVVHPRMQRR